MRSLFSKNQILALSHERNQMRIINFSLSPQDCNTFYQKSWPKYYRKTAPIKMLKNIIGEAEAENNSQIIEEIKEYEYIFIHRKWKNMLLIIPKL